MLDREQKNSKQIEALVPSRLYNYSVLERFTRQHDAISSAECHKIPPSGGDDQLAYVPGGNRVIRRERRRLRCFASRIMPHCCKRARHRDATPGKRRARVPGAESRGGDDNETTKCRRDTSQRRRGRRRGPDRGWEIKRETKEKKKRK